MIEVIDSKFKVTTTPTGVFEYSHPDCSAIITSDYRIMNATNRKPLKVYENPRLIGGQISARFKQQRSNFSFGRLLALMAGQDKNGYYRIINGDEPLTLKNVSTFKESPVVQSQGKLELPTRKAYDGRYNHLIAMIDNEALQPYLPDHEDDESGLKFKTEDGVIFTDRVKALSHQLSVDKGKELANMVLEGKGGWVLAEQMYRTQVSYFTGLPLDYNFRTIMENNEGIVEMGEKKYIVKEGSSPFKFETKEEMEKWITAKALINMIVDYNYDPSEVAKVLQ